MTNSLIRVGTIYLPVTNPKHSAEWFCTKLGAELQMLDADNNHAIVNLANQSFILIQSEEGVSSNFPTINDGLMFAFTFEVAGEQQLIALHHELKEKGVHVGEIEDRGHPGRNFIIHDPDGNRFDVWSELAPNH